MNKYIGMVGTVEVYFDRDNCLFKVNGVQGKTAKARIHTLINEIVGVGMFELVATDNDKEHKHEYLLSPRRTMPLTMFEMFADRIARGGV